MIFATQALAGRKKRDELQLAIQLAAGLQENQLVYT